MQLALQTRVSSMADAKRPKRLSCWVKYRACRCKPCSHSSSSPQTISNSRAVCDFARARLKRLDYPILLDAVWRDVLFGRETEKIPKYRGSFPFLGSVRGAALRTARYGVAGLRAMVLTTTLIVPVAVTATTPTAVLRSVLVSMLRAGPEMLWPCIAVSTRIAHFDVVVSTGDPAWKGGGVSRTYSDRIVAVGTRAADIVGRDSCRIFLAGPGETPGGPSSVLRVVLDSESRWILR